MSRAFRHLVKWFYLLIAAVLIALAVMVQSGRSFSHLLGDYNQDIADYLAEKLNAQVAIGQIDARWDGLKPSLDVRDFSISNHAGLPILAFDRARIRLDLVESLVNFRLVWNSAVLRDVKVDFVQMPKGNWHIKGLPEAKETDKSALAKTANSRVRLDALLDMLLLSNRIEFQSSRLNFEFNDGNLVVLDAPQLLIENTPKFHRLSLQVDLDNQARSVYLVAEGQGDPRNKEQFRSAGYLQLNHFPTSEPMAAASAFLLHGNNSKELKSEGQVDANIWFASRAQGDGFDISGNLGLQRLLLPFAGRQLQLDGFETDITGYWNYDGSWFMGLQNLGAQLKDRAISKINLGIKSTGIQQPLQLRMDQMDLQRLVTLLNSAGTLGSGKLQDILQTLSPEGLLTNLRVDLPLSNPAQWTLKANVSQVGVNAWRGVPALRGVDGYLEASAKQGFININSQHGFSMHYVPTYDAPMEYEQVKGQVAWQLRPDENKVFVNSGRLEFRSPNEAVNGYMWLALPWKAHTGDIDLYLQLGAKNLAASLYKKYVPALVPDSLHQWLEQSIGAANPGVARDLGFIYRGTLLRDGELHPSKNFADRNFDLYLNLENCALNYHAELPALSHMNGRLQVSNGQVSASVDSAKLYESTIESAQVDVNPTGDKGSLLKIVGALNGPSTDGMRVLREGMLRKYIGSSMDTWTLNGALHTDLDLAIPLGGSQRKGYQNVDASIAAPKLSLGNLNVSLTELAGVISYHSDKGLFSNGTIPAQLFGEPVALNISTVANNNRQSKTQIDFSGNISVQNLANWSHRPEVLFLNGNIPYRARVSLFRPNQAADAISKDAISNGEAINHSADLTAEEFVAGAFAQVEVKSDLNGVAVDLPGIFAKPANTNLPLTFNLWLREQESQIDMSYGDLVRAQLRQDRQQPDQLKHALISLGTSANLNSHWVNIPEFLVMGNLPDFNLDEWKKVQQRYVDFQQKLKVVDAHSPEPSPEPNIDNTAANLNSSGDIAGLPFKAKLNIAQYMLGKIALNDLWVEASRDATNWYLAIKNPVVAGNLVVPIETDKALAINLDYLHLPKFELLSEAQTAQVEAEPADAQKETELSSEGQASPAISFSPKQLPRAQIEVKDLSFDGSNYGAWSLVITPIATGAQIEHLRGKIKGLTIGGKNNEADGATLIWQVDDAGERTHFMGGISAGNIADVMKQWEKPDTVESERANFITDFSWAGAPQDFKLEDINGQVSLRLEKGRFKREAGAEDGILRLMSVLNFDSIARRLRLDFSDLYTSGLAYDEIKGKVQFKQGIMMFDEPLEVTGPSSRLQMAGSLDLRKQSINTRLVATLPVAGNLTFFTALATGLPAAAGVYLVSKLFKKQVDQVTSISYTIHGSWSEPKMAFDRLFESEESLRESKEAKAGEDQPADELKKQSAAPAENSLTDESQPAEATSLKKESSAKEESTASD